MHRLLLAAGLLVAGCADMEPFDPPVADEMQPGPGLFSGPTGEFVLLRPTGEAPAAESEAPEAESEAPEAPVSTPPPRRKLTDPPPP